MNYSIEGNIDFYAELLNSVCESTISSKVNQENENNDLCLITQQPLEEHYVTLDCNHKFNYLPLFNEVKRQKSSSVISNSFETTKLKINEIKCPYCRYIQPKLLPYVKIPGNTTLFHGVTFPVKYRMGRIKCPCILKSGKRKGEICGRDCDKAEGYCNIHLKSIKNKEDKEKQNKKTKIKKGKSVDNKKIIGCSCILKSGKRKGEPCNLKVFKDNLCKRHFNLKQK